MLLKGKEIKNWKMRMIWMMKKLLSRRRLQFEDVNLVFFPIISHDHYYLIVFNIIKGTSVIIDNSDSDGTYEGKYKENYEFVFFVEYHL
ncbi:hypothetical protein CTI12_AA316580 [Artemisia annua]|uniref:Ulp1 protease family, C-terminal catalytic domain-containing protein n=1 Tax=Artemisia annua TaxID=35608 RepID=A0A2U1N2L8_ARTAN|nr:hypothetical protein CTI12_AA316580 [Artemisia annua]